MRSLLSLFSIPILLLGLLKFAAPPNDNIGGAINLTTLTGYCSDDAAYSNLEATRSLYRKGSFWGTEGKDIWYKFTAIRTDINITVTGNTGGTSTNTLLSPLIAIYTLSGTTLTEIIGSMVSSNNLTTAYKGGLTIGQEYYIRISAEDDNTGTFKLCINNYDPPNKPGQDCSTASLLCNKDTFSETNISGAGNNNKEAQGTCLNIESNSAWYKWTAANSGTLTFSITPTSNTDDIDWVLFDLGINGDCSKVIPSNAIRCAAGNGINCTPSYYITGLNMTSTDLSEQSNCVPGQDGWLKYVDMIEGHTYALLIDNFSNGNNGFTLAFGGTGEFKGPASAIQVVKNDPCTTQQSFTFSAGLSDAVSYKWEFGKGASITDATGLGPHVLTYSSMGQKNVILKSSNSVGCSAYSYYNLYVTTTPETPVISSSKTILCVDDVLELYTPLIEDAKYSWSGPNNFKSEQQNPQITITGPENSGDYKLTIQVGACASQEAVLHIPDIPKKPIALFYTSPNVTGKYSSPISIGFNNQSKNSTRFIWDFGDGESSTEKNPIHTYATPGIFQITLTAISENDCSHSVSLSGLTLLKENAVLVPNAFSPNGDSINDELKISIPNLINYHITIFNRWGTKIFETTDIFHNWNGKYNNQNVPVGTYYYLIKAKDLNNKNISQSGSVTLIR